jgi:hypothetical protein
MAVNTKPKEMRGVNPVTKSLVVIRISPRFASARYEHMCGGGGRSGRYGSRFHFLPARRCEVQMSLIGI